MTQSLPSPAHRHLMPPGLFERILALAELPCAQTLISKTASASALLTAAEQYLAEAAASGLPREHWRVLHGKADFRPWLHSPLSTLWNRGSPNPNAARAALALAAGGCSIWSSDWTASNNPALSAEEHTFIDPGVMATWIFSRSSASTRAAYLRIALADPLTSPLFARYVKGLYERAVQGSSQTAAGSLGPADTRAKAACSLIVECEEEISRPKAPGAPGATGLRATLDKARERLALKSQPAAGVDPKRLKKSLTAEQKESLSLLGAVLREAPRDAERVISALDALPWLKANPDIACLNFPQGSLISQALEHGSAPALRWLADAGANLWLASAQAGDSDACHWATRNIYKLSPGDELIPIARMLLRGAWLDGGPDPKARCVELACAAVEEFCRSFGHIPKALAEARGLLAAIESESIEELLAPSAPAKAAPSPFL